MGKLKGTSTTAIKEISSNYSLERAWNNLLHNASSRGRNTRGIDGLSINDFSLRLDRYLHEISAAIRSPSGYQFSPLITALLPKPNGKTRVICIPTVADRIVQRSIVDFLTTADKCGIINTVSYGFIKGRSVKTAGRKAKKLRQRHRWAYKADIAKFFDSIPRPSLFTSVKKVVKQHSLHKLLQQAISCEISELDPRRMKKIREAGLAHGVGVRQGMPLSPIFANIMLRDFDRHIELEGINMVRYADDLIVLCDSEDECVKVHRDFVSELSKIGLTIPDPGTGSKTVIYNPSESAEFLGVGLVPNGTGFSLDILSAQTTKIYQVIQSIANFDTLAKEGVTIGRFGQKLDGVISGYLAAYDYCDNYKQFEQGIASAKKKALQALYEDGLGLSLASMTDSQRFFLGV